MSKRTKKPTQKQRLERLEKEARQRSHQKAVDQKHAFFNDKVLARFNDGMVLVKDRRDWRATGPFTRRYETQLMQVGIVLNEETDRYEFRMKCLGNLGYKKVRGVLKGLRCR